MRTWFLRHWFWGVMLIIAAVWLITNVAYALGAKSITFPNRYGPKPTIDFMREHERPVVSLGTKVGLLLDHNGPQVRGTVVKLEPGLPVLCWVCGSFDTSGTVAQAEYRSGDWFFRAPDDHRLVRLEGLREEIRDAFRTVAYNRATAERVMLPPEAGVAEQSAALRRLGLEPGEAVRLSPTSMSDLAPVSMQSEGCVIFEMAFVAAALLWSVCGGLAWLLVRTARRLRAGRKPSFTP